MRVKQPLLLFAAAIAAVLISTSPTQARQRHAQADTLAWLLQRHREAAGQPDTKSGSCHSIYTLSTGGMAGTMEEFDFPPAKYRVNVDMGPLHVIDADDGVQGWEQDSTGNVRIIRGPELTENRAAANFSIESFDPLKDGSKADVHLRPQRDPVTHDYIIDATPAGGTPQTIYINPKTFLADKMIMNEAGITGTITVSSYRKVDGVQTPEHIAIGYAGLPILVTADLKTIEYGVTEDPSMFRLPVAARDFEFLKSTDHDVTVVPFDFEDNEIIVPVTINGHKLRFALDSGSASSFISSDAARSLNLTTEGAVSTLGYGGESKSGISAHTTVDVGDSLRLKGQLLYVVDLPGGVLSRSLMDGALGYDIFARFVVRIDFAHRQLILAAPGADVATETTAAVVGNPIILPIKLANHTPTVEAAVDGRKPAHFLIDTGDSGDVHLFNRYAVANGLVSKLTAHGASIKVGFGVGGLVQEVNTPGHTLKIGPVPVSNVLIATVNGSGIADVSDLAGGIGNTVLDRFMVTFDYSNNTIRFDRTMPAPIGRTAPLPVAATPTRTPTPQPASPNAAATPPAPMPPSSNPVSPSPTPAASSNTTVPPPALPVPSPPVMTTQPAPTATATPTVTADPASSRQPSLIVDLTLPELMARHLSAIGGADALNAIANTRMEEEVSTGGIDGDVTTVYASPDKEYEEDKLGVMDVLQGYNGKQAWRADGNGNIRPLSADEMSDLRNQLFFDTNSYVLPGRLPGKMTLRPFRDAQTRDYMVDVIPEGGKPATLYFDPQSYMIVREEHSDDEIQTVTSFSDFSKVDGVMFPMTQHISNGNARYDISLKVTDIKDNVDLSASLFDPPVRPARYTFIKAGATSASVGIDTNEHQIGVRVIINGHKERILLDTGASTLAIAASIAGPLKLKQGGIIEAVGYGGSTDLHPVEISSIEFPGALRLNDITGVTVNLPGELDKATGDNVAGFIGYDLLSQFVVRLDYAARKITLIEPSAFHPTPADGQPLDVDLNNDIPTVTAQVDGLAPARYLIDTGDYASIRFFEPYISNNKLDKKYPNGDIIAGGGIAGVSESRSTVIDSFSLAGVTFKKVPAEFSLDPTGGSSQLNAGALGYGLLSRFVVTFDYPDGKVYFASTPKTSRPFSD